MTIFDDEAVKLFRRLQERLKAIDVSTLPSVPINEPEIKGLSKISVIYFLRHESQGVLYIGKALDLKSRWRLSKFNDTGITWRGQCHEKLRKALDLGGVALHWWVCPYEYLIATESLFIQIHRPLWNFRDNSELPSGEQKRAVFEMVEHRYPKTIIARLTGLSVPTITRIIRSTIDPV